MELFERDSVKDLICRGISRADILARTGVDADHGPVSYIRELRGVDKIRYSVEFVLQTVSRDVFAEYLRAYGEGKMTVADIFSACGVVLRRGLNLAMLATEFGLSDEYAAARSANYMVRSQRVKATFVRKYGTDNLHEIPGRDDKFRETMLARYGVASPLQSAELKSRAAQTMRERYGVDFALQSADVREKSKATCLSRYGVEYAIQSRDVQNKAVAGMVARYGVERPLQNPDCLAKCKTTCLSRYGSESSLGCQEVREKAAATMLERYGTDEVWSIPGVREKFAETCRVRYGCDNPMRNREIYEKASATCERRYGVPTRKLLTLPVMASKVRDTTMEHYGVEYGLQSDVVKARFRATMEARYGVAYSLQSPSIRERIEATMWARYGARNAFLVPEFREKAADTCEARYGVRHPSQSFEIRDRTVATNMARYGVPYAMMSSKVVDKCILSKMKNGTFSSSAPEDRLYAKLVEVFGETGVVRQYKSDLYPFYCDFYVKSRDMFIELNGYVSHGGHWFGASPYDADILDAYLRSDSRFLRQVMDVWFERDVKKRETARRNNLNYVVFWGDQAQDADLWFAMGCPDGRDWDRMYSWLPERVLSYDGDWPEKLAVAGKSIPAAVRMADWQEFYKRELVLWDLNYDNKWGTVQARLYANRLKYAHKLPDELTDREILRGLNIAGMVRAYSHFDNAGMAALLADYNIKSVYDPCAGWGERMLTCMAAGIRYDGTDINPAAIDAHMLLLDKYRDYAIHGAAVVLGDSAERDMTVGTHEAVFTCPPYGDREIYTEFGAENLDQDMFLDWWRRVIEHSVSGTTRVFAYQIDQIWKDRMNAVLESLGWRLDRQIQVGRNRVSHMTRSRGDGTKHNFEEVQVFVR